MPTPCYANAVRRILFIIIGLTIVVGAYALFAMQRTIVANPDPNHTHADFAVWVNGKQLDFSGPEFMSGTSEEDDPDHTKHDPYLHLHDGNGHVIHRHKPGLNIGMFFTSLGLDMDNGCTPNPGSGCIRKGAPLRMFVNGSPFLPDGETATLDRHYVFHDGDQILLTDAMDDREVRHQLGLMTDDACKYSQTCPWRGKPPVENCIADPTVPCVQE